MTFSGRIRITETDSITAIPAVAGIEPGPFVRIGSLRLDLGANDLERVGNIDRLTAALNELRKSAIHRLVIDEATVILRTGLDSPFGAGETVEASRG